MITAQLLDPIPVLGIFVGYAAFYLVRKNFALAIPDILKEHPEYTKAALGSAMTGLSVYGLVSAFGASGPAGAVLGAWLLAAVMQAGQKPDRLRITAQRLIWLIQRHKSMQTRWFKHDVFDANVGVDLLII